MTPITEEVAMAETNQEIEPQPSSWFRKIVAGGCPIALLAVVAGTRVAPSANGAGGSAVGAPPSALTKVFAPVPVATPPEMAWRGLLVEPTGRLRHLGFQGDGSQTPDFLPKARGQWLQITSDDHGRTWSAPQPYTGLGPAAWDAQSGFWYNIELRRTRPNDATSATTVVRRARSLDGTDWEEIPTGAPGGIMNRPPRRFPRCGLLLAANHFNTAGGDKAALRKVTFFASADGVAWRYTMLPMGPSFTPKPPHLGWRWENNTVEPTIAELADGTLWILARTSQDEHWQSFSHDAGLTWSAWEPSRFPGTLTMPTFHRDARGRLLVFFCNTVPLPEADKKTLKGFALTGKNGGERGQREDVFTNRDASHVAISDDDGKTWRGFRELRLSDTRHDADHGTGDAGVPGATLDRSVHQHQAVNLPDGTIAVANGQHPRLARIVLFNPQWLYETRRASRFEDGLASWSVQSYIDGIVGHCSWNREPGPQLIDHPDLPGAHCLRIRRARRSHLVDDHDGATWNFPAGRNGTLTVELRLEPGFQGARLCLTDRWWNPTDPVVHSRAPYVLPIAADGALPGGPRLAPGAWTTLRFTWSDCTAAPCTLRVGGATTMLPLQAPATNGISYVHLRSSAETYDDAGLLLAGVAADTTPP